MTRITLALGLILLAGAGSAWAQEAAGKAAPVPHADKAGIQWVSIPGGSFMMGSGSSAWQKSEKPRHHVTVPTFQIAKTLVTNKQYKACVDAGACSPAHVFDGTCLGGSYSPGNIPDSFQGDDKPVVCVDWEQAQKFSAWAGGRLPTEAEWEYAARGGGKEQEYPWGNKPWTCTRVTDGITCPSSGRMMPVCSNPAGNTQQGLCDMAGKVRQWTQDFYHDTYDGAPNDGSAREDPMPVREGYLFGRVVRGYPGNGARVVERDYANRDPKIPFFDVGFRPGR